ncbi:flagella synthesis protein FlgN [Marinimicrobium sp. ARAG 43.8]|uniref:flagella synthesis protein FlgN n=1 Tax=Marinimicrobium sp. ARAG 43.8 TaxID=3418719 RepID=UPI003CEF5698
MTPSPDYLREMLTLDQQRIDQLETLLEQEREALEQRHHETLSGLIDTKQQLMAALGEHARQRQSWLEAAGLNRDHEGWQRWLQQRPDGQAQIPQWQALATRFEHCKTLNDINGKIIQRAQSSLGQLLKLMRGQTTDGPSLYNAQGQSGGAGESQTLGKA